MKTLCMIMTGLVCLADAEIARPMTYCRFVPERKDDFAWENDKVAFRAYGPALRSGEEDSGIDCWLKRVKYPIIDKWYKAGNYHKDHGEGCDPYHVGSSRGCGGLGLWVDGRMVTSDTFKTWKILKCEREESEFALNYEYRVGDDTYLEEKKVTIRLCNRLFKVVSTFRKNDAPAVGLPIAVGITTHDGKAAVSKDVSAGWMACWESIEGFGLGTGVVMDPACIEQFKVVEGKAKDDGHALFIIKTDAEGQVEYHAGYGWEHAGEITTSEAWNKYLESFEK